MNSIRKFFGKMFNFKTKGEPKPTVEHFSIPAPKPSAIRRIFRAFRQPKKRQAIGKVGIGHGMHRLKPLARGFVGGKPFGKQSIRHLGRAFKEAFEKEYGVRLK